MSEQQLVVGRHEGGVTRLTLNRPEHSNRLTYAMMTQLIAGLEQAHEQADVLVIAAAGSDFTVGRDQGERVEGVTKRDNLSLILRANRLLRGFPGVSILAARGRLRGFGAGLAVQSDITLLSEDATIAFDEITHGFAPTIVLTYLGDAIGRKRAIELTGSARVLQAPEAVAYGLASRVVADLDHALEELVEGIAGRDRGALRMCKRLVGELPALAMDVRESRALDALTT